MNVHNKLKPYVVGYNNEGNMLPMGPGNGLGYYSATLWPELVCENEKEAIRATKIANIAYTEGYKQAQADIVAALGLTIK